MKVKLITTLYFNTREELVTNLIEIIEDNLLHDGDCPLPDDWKNVNAWTLDDIKDFLTYNGRHLVENFYDLSEIFDDRITPTKVLLED